MDRRPTAADRESQAAERWLGRLATSLAAEERALEAPGFDELSRAVDGRLDPTEAGLWDERLARDAILAERVRSLESFRSEAYPEVAERIAFPSRWQLHPAGWWVAAAAAVAVLGISFLLSLPGDTAPSEAVHAPAPPTSGPEVLFEDGFEDCDALAWTSASNAV